ncbi:MAG: hypothetical protein WAL90_10745 [Desulfobacterales bacterium]
MYLARKYIRGRLHYYIRESYRDDDGLRSRELFDLGIDPTCFIIYPGGNAYYIDEVVEDSLAACGSPPTGDQLDDIFWVFIDPEIRIKLEPFRRREMRGRKARHTVADAPPDTRHIFDRRRLVFLKTGQKNLSHIDSVPEKMFGVLASKSRDELEQQFIDMERSLQERELKTYVYAAFNLQDFFTESFAKSVPDFLDQAKVDDHFVEEICKLNADRQFWAGVEPFSGLNEYLIRYAIMFFDFEYEPRSFMDDYIRSFANGRRAYRPPVPQPTVSMAAACRIFGESQEALLKMSRRELARLYRRRARALHPDQGGHAPQFIKLTEAYKSLQRQMN